MPPPTTGQRLNNRKILQILASLNHSVEQVDFRFTSKEILNGFGSKIRFLLHEVNLFFLSLRKVAMTDLVYLPIHQSLVGLLRYMPYLITILLLNKKYTIRLEGSTIVQTYGRCGFLGREVLSFVFRKAIAVIHLSNFTRTSEPFARLSNNVVLPNTHSIEPVENTSLRKDRSRANILYLSQISVSKGIVDLLETCRLLDERGLDFKLSVAGSFSGEVYTTCRYYKNLLPEKIEFCGLLHGREKHELLVNSDVFVLPSRLMEGQPLSIIEAMATGNAVVSTRVGGVVDIIEDEVNGYLVEPSNVSQLAEAIETLITDKAALNRIKENNVSHSIKYGDELFNNNIKSLFESLLST